MSFSIAACWAAVVVVLLATQFAPADAVPLQLQLMKSSSGTGDALGSTTGSTVNQTIDSPAPGAYSCINLGVSFCQPAADLLPYQEQFAEEYWPAAAGSDCAVCKLITPEDILQHGSLA